MKEYLVIWYDMTNRAPNGSVIRKDMKIVGVDELLEILNDRREDGGIVVRELGNVLIDWS